MKLDLQSIRVIHKINYCNWKRNNAWIIGSLSLFVLQVIMGSILCIPLSIALMILLVDSMLVASKLIVVYLLGVILLLSLLFIGVFMKVALTRASLDYIRKERYQMENFFKGFYKYGRSLKASLVMLLIIIFSSVPMFLGIGLGVYLGKTWVIIIGIGFVTVPIYVGIMYSQVFYMIQEDDTGLTTMTILKGSKELMEGYKMRYALTLLPLVILLIIPSYFLSTYLWFYTASMETFLVVQYIIGVVSLVLWSYILSIKGYFYLGLITKEVPQEKKKDEIKNSEEFSIYEK